MNPTEEEHAINLAEYYQLLLRNKWIILFSLVIMLFLAVRYNARLVPIYRATATLIIDRQTPNLPITGLARYYETYLSESLSFNTHFELISSRTVLEKVIDDLKLDKMNMKQAKEEFREINPVKLFLSRIQKNILLLLNQKKPDSSSMNARTALVEALKRIIAIENVEETRLLKINVSSPSPVRARDIANGVAQAYINFNINNRLKSSKDTLSWLTDRLYEMKKRLEHAEEEFLTYKQDVELISVDDKQRVIAQKITDFNNTYLQARNKRLELDAELKQLERIAQSGKNTSLPRSLLENALITNLHTQLVNAELDLSRLTKVYKPKHPKFIQIKSEITQISKKLTQEIKRELDNLKSERVVLLSREKVLQQTISDFEKEGMETNKKEFKYSRLKRNVEMNQKLYDTLLSRIKEADISENIDVSNIRITEKAQLPTSSTGSNRQRNLLLGVILGLMLGIGISFFREYIDRSLHTEESVQKYLGLPVLSVIPLA